MFLIFNFLYWCLPLQMEKLTLRYLELAKVVWSQQWGQDAKASYYGPQAVSIKPYKSVTDPCGSIGWDLKQGHKSMLTHLRTRGIFIGT